MRVIFDAQLISKLKLNCNRDIDAGKVKQYEAELDAIITIRVDSAILIFGRLYARTLTFQSGLSLSCNDDNISARLTGLKFAM